MTRQLIKYEDYDRREVHKIFDPLGHFSRYSPWGLHGIVKLPHRDDFVFFVTYGRAQAGHIFRESITKNGIIYWQSQPSQALDNPTIVRFINHDHWKSSIYLFLRTDSTRKYTYLGRLAYITHDREREKPVHFKWQILDWEISPEKAEEIGLELVDDEPAYISDEIRNNFIKTEPPMPLPTINGVSSKSFKASPLNLAENEKARSMVELAGQRLVYELEKDYLTSFGRVDLADNVVHTSIVEGDGAAFDIQSFDLQGRPKFIGVKTTTGGPSTPFIIALNELCFSRKHASNYVLVRVYDFNVKSRQGKYYECPGDLSEFFTFEPIEFRAFPRR